ncbi:MAG: DUF1801 domain-containing protein [Planctomycetota bacterium]
MRGTKTVDEYIAKEELWQPELTRLREILNSTELEETVKWGAPCYTLDGKLVVGIAGFKNYFALWFHQGALLADPEKVLINAQEGRTKALRQWRFESKKDIKVRTIKAYVKESIELQRAGKKITADRNKPLVVPPQLRAAFKKNATAKTSFATLTKGKQREYADYIAEAKREETKEKRLAKILPMITAGKGLNDKYRNC